MTAPHPLRCETCIFDPASTDFCYCPLWKNLTGDRDYKIEILGQMRVTTRYTGCASHSSAVSEREKVLDEYNAELLTKVTNELFDTWRSRDTKLFSIIRKYRRVPIGAMKTELRQNQHGERE